MNFILRGNWKTLFFIKVFHYPKVISSSMFLLSLRQVIWQRSFGEVGGGEWGSTSSLPNLNNFNFALNRKTCLFWCYALNYRPGEFLVSSFLCRKTVPQHNIWLKKVVQLATQGFKQSIQRRRLTTTSKYYIQTGLTWCHRQSRISSVTLLSTFPQRFQVLQTHPPLQSRTGSRSTTTT